jgi:transcriptional regulator with XRE-family HTH domain
MDTFSRGLGDVLRRTRQGLGLTLHDMQRISRGSFKPSTIAGYERGERMISLERFRMLAALYGVPADQLLAEALEESNGGAPERLVIDLDRITRLPEPERMIVAEHVHAIRTRRGDFLTTLVPLRSRDLDSIAMSARLNVRAMLDRLRPALASSRGRRRTGPRGKSPTPLASPTAVRSGGSSTPFFAGRVAQRNSPSR